MKTNQVESLQLHGVGEPPAVRAPGGRVIHDPRGNARWDWAVSTGVLAKKTVAELLNTLGVPTLAIDRELELATPAGDPYNRCGRRA